MRYPEFLEKNGTIGFVAPAFGCATEPYKSAFANARRTFEKLGHTTVAGENCYADLGIGISNTPQKCGEELNEAYCSEESRILMSCGGGELMCEVVPYIDFERINMAKPKWFMGYSDNTNFTFLLTTLCDTAAIYGPCAPAFGMQPWHASLHDAYDILCGQKREVRNYDFWERESLKDENRPLEPYHVTEPFRLRRFPDEEVTIKGRLVGGCMDCLVNLLGTSFDEVHKFNERYEEDGIIWFLESCDLNIMSIRRALWQMKNAGWFEHVKGFLIGRPYCYGSEMFGMDQYEAVMGILAEYEVPVIMDLDIGHLAPMMPMISGALAKVHSAGNEIDIRYIFE